MGYYVNSFYTLRTASVDCGHPGNVTNGTVDVSEGTKVNSKIYYTCDRGYRLNGPSWWSNRICLSDGTWSGREPTCEGMHVWVITSCAFTSGTMSAHTTQHHYIGIIDQWK